MDRFHSHPRRTVLAPAKNPPARNSFVLAAIALSAACTGTSGDDATSPVLLDERFACLERWEEHAFPRVPERSVYEIASDNDNAHYLRMSSDGG